MLSCFGIISNPCKNKTQVGLSPYLKKKKKEKKQTGLTSTEKNIDTSSVQLVVAQAALSRGGCFFVFSSFKMGGRKYFVLECQELGRTLPRCHPSFPFDPLAPLLCKRRDASF